MRGKNNQPERFWEVVDKSKDCWIFEGPLSHNGYGQFYINGKTTLAHRYAYKLAIGDIPEGLLVCHTCDVRNCVRPDHLWLGTAKENTQDMMDKGKGVALKRSVVKHARGEEVRKLRAEFIQELHRRGYSSGEIAHGMEMYATSVVSIIDRVKLPRYKKGE